MAKPVPEHIRDYFRRLGKKGGKARAKRLTAEERKAIAQKGGAAPKLRKRMA